MKTIKRTEENKFDNFIVAKENRQAYQVCYELNRLSNLAIIYGDGGRGKTHLLKACKEYHADKTVEYITCENFLNEFTRNMRNSTLDEFKNIFRSCDVLLIDDISYLNNKPATQEEFFYTITQLLDSSKMVILSSCIHPHKIKLIAQLKNLLASALIVELKQQEEQTKVEIIQLMANNFEISLNNEEATYIAKCVENGFEIKGAILQIKQKSII